MKYRILFTIIFTLSAISQSFSQGYSKSGQRYVQPFGQMSLTVGLGVAYYMGDLRDGIDMKHLGLGPSISLGGQFRLSENFSARGEFRYYQVKADQQYSKNYQNNLSFRTRNPDINLGIQADLFGYNRHAPINPYLFAGVGATFMTPKAKLGDNWYSLAPLMTENEKYNRLPLVFTGGIGVSVKTTDKLSLGLELCNNFVNSDYLDDVSTTYPDPDALASDLARQLSDRSPEIGLPPRMVGGLRGGAAVKDSYLFFQFRAQYMLGNLQQARARKKLRCNPI
ncbi:outer membrane protein with beta-barrel domain [Dyadobacter jejuensis]|uniref:Outer membrane protein with beta-barrel domain n=1 Tax=Dyadobacter jejuensis TaxID=1082580 RepID=A0A316ASB2_9BACT|nr:outer membrane beta-barrel protein [Dyadobacter jejuensis]PWJ60189.1 outer membrane protein with beta-barrel domain [Dyadobacter jejuensis]